MKIYLYSFFAALLLSLGMFSPLASTSYYNAGDAYHYLVPFGNQEPPVADTDPYD